ncbi:MAG: hypothetical protein AMJ53_18100 [Gammaproteobacteria bacterium SG8_11]|nr:MAG: hypothetical protein AMJ53_18100 [Gammaproteobacteria bacterium SG8_11]
MKKLNLQIVWLAILIFYMLPVWAVDISVNIGAIIGGDNKAGNNAPAQTKNAPPDHAPAHGYRKKHQYRYYPSAEVYFEPARSLYFYLSDSQWKVTASLPNSLKIQLGSAVSIEMDSDKPYTKHAEHKAKHPPGLAKNKAKTPKVSHHGQNKGKGNKHN